MADRKERPLESRLAEFPSLGWIASDWVTRHCVVPDGFDQAQPFRLSNEQLTFFVDHYRVKPVAKLGQLAPAFTHRRSQLVRPQKWGKGPLTAAQVCLEGVGPSLFAGWAKGGEVWRCSDHGCRCGWSYSYAPGEPMAMAWPTPLIQITAFSEDQTGNIYDALRPMIELGPLAKLIPKTGTEFTRLPNGGRIDTVTSNAQSRLGARVTFVVQDETGIWTRQNGMVKVAETQRRGLAGMGGRAVETTNGWDPAEDSVAQRTAQAKAKDINRDHILAPPTLSYRVKVERRKIHEYVYSGAPWVDLDAIEAEAAELIELDPAQAERFFGNRIRAAEATAFDSERWAALVREDYMPARGSAIVVGADGARYSDAIAVVGTEIATGFQWVISVKERPESADDDYEHPFDEVDADVTEAFDQWKVSAIYIDPQYIDHLVDMWAGRWGKRVKSWTTNRPKQAAYMIRAYTSAQTSGDVTHNGDETFAQHIANARRRKVNVFDDEHRQMSVISKEAPGSPMKIDLAMAGALSWEARGDAIALGALKSRSRPSVFV